MKIKKVEVKTYIQTVICEKNECDGTMSYYPNEGLAIVPEYRYKCNKCNRIKVLENPVNQIVYKEI